MDIELIAKYGYWGVFIWSALDHTGTPATLIVAMSLVVAGVLDLFSAMVFAFAGALFADLILYVLAYYIGHPIINVLANRIKIIKKPIEKCELFFDNYGPQVIIWGRFLAIISRYIPLVCGTIKVNPLKYFSYSTVGNVLMNFCFGFLIYKFWLELAEFINNPKSVFYISLAIIVGQIIFTFLYFKIKKLVKRTQ